MSRVIVVDDKPENLYLLRALLQAHGYEVDEARHGAEALVKARANPPQLIISDLLMPVMDGYTLLRHWKADERLKLVPFVVYTATYTEPADERLALQLGADLFLVKPAEPEPFVARIRDVLARSQAGELTPPKQPTGEEPVLLREYSEVLVRKLEEKAAQLEQANRVLEQDLTALRRTEAALRRSEERFRDLIAQAADGMLIADADGHVRDVNPALCAMLGYSPEELLRLHVSQVVAAHEHERIEPAMAEVKAGRPHLGEWTYRRKDGSTLVVEVSARSLHEGGAIGMVRDLTERRRTEAALAESAHRLDFVIQGTGTGLWDWDLVTDRVHYSREWKQLLGYEEHEVADDLDEWRRLCHPDDVEPTMKKVGAFLERPDGPLEAEFRMRHKNGEYRWILSRAAAQVDGHGKAVRLLGLHTDVTERRQDQDQLRERERVLAALISTLPGAVFRVRNDPNYTAEYVSDQIAELTGYPAADFRENRRNFGELMHPDDRDRVWNETQKALGEHRPYEVTYRFHDARGQVRWNWERGTGIFAANGELQAVEGFIQDVTERKWAEEQIQAQLHELQRWYSATLDREGRVQELKREVNQLLARLGEPVRYASRDGASQPLPPTAPTGVQPGAPDADASDETRP